MNLPTCTRLPYIRQEGDPPIVFTDSQGNRLRTHIVYDNNGFPCGYRIMHAPAGTIYMNHTPKTMNELFKQQTTVVEAGCFKGGEA